MCVCQDNFVLQKFSSFIFLEIIHRKFYFILLVLYANCILFYLLCPPEAPEAPPEKPTSGSHERGTYFYWIQIALLVQLLPYYCWKVCNKLLIFNILLNSDAALARVETEKRMSLIKAWEENEKAKAENKLAFPLLYIINISFTFEFKRLLCLTIICIMQGNKEVICHFVLGECKEGIHRSSAEKDRGRSFLVSSN